VGPRRQRLEAEKGGARVAAGPTAATGLGPRGRSEKKDGPRAGIEGGRAGGFAGLGRIPREDDFSFFLIFFKFICQMIFKSNLNLI
jgi:hypothetical protein